MKTTIEVPFRVGNDIYFMHHNKIAKDCIEMIETKTYRNFSKPTILIHPMKKDREYLRLEECFNTKRECINDFLKRSEIDDD